MRWVDCLLTTWTLRLPVQTCVFAAGHHQVIKMYNYGAAPTPIVAVRQQTDHHPWLHRTSRLTAHRVCR